jgi:F-type H+-transporting ATPase subunit b
MVRSFGSSVLPRALSPAAFGGAVGTYVLLGAVSLGLGSEGADAHHVPSITSLLFPLINFGIYVFILRRFAWPPLVQYLSERRSRVAAELEAAGKARREAEAKKNEYEAKLKTLEAEAERVRAEVLAIAAQDAARLVSAAELSAERIRRDARLVADQEVARAKQALRAESAELIAQLAAGLLARRVTADDEARIVDEFITDLPGSAQTTRAGREGEPR